MAKRRLNRHKNFLRCVELLAETYDRADEVIEGALWTIARAPSECGVLNDDLGVWQAKILPDTPAIVLPETLLLYAFDDVEVRMRTILLRSQPRFFDAIFKSPPGP